MLGKLPDGTLIQLKKGCGCIDHNVPHWVHVDQLWRDSNRKLMSADGKTAVQHYYGLQGFAIEEAARLQAKLADFRANGIVELVSEPSDELTEIQRVKIARHYADLCAPEPEPESPYLDDKTRVRMEARELV